MQVWIKKYNGGTLENQYEAKNIVNFDQGLDIPVQTFAMPESSSDDAILTKAEGNVEKINFSWIIKDEALVFGRVIFNIPGILPSPFIL